MCDRCVGFPYSVARVAFWLFRSEFCGASNSKVHYTVYCTLQLDEGTLASLGESGTPLDEAARMAEAALPPDAAKRESESDQRSRIVVFGCVPGAESSRVNANRGEATTSIGGSTGGGSTGGSIFNGRLTGGSITGGSISELTACAGAGVPGGGMAGGG